jgi:hypothetical protein
MTAADWFYAQNDEQLGPVSKSELKVLATRGDLSPDDMVWNSSWDDWRPASSLSGLFSPHQSSPPPPVVSTESNSGNITAAEAISLFDLKFETFLTPRLIGLVYAISLFLFGAGIIAVTVYAFFTEPAWLVVLIFAAALLVAVIYAVAIRCVLEMMLLSFRAVEHLAHLENLKHDTNH